MTPSVSFVKGEFGLIFPKIHCEIVRWKKNPHFTMGQYKSQVFPQCHHKKKKKKPIQIFQDSFPGSVLILLGIKKQNASVDFFLIAITSWFLFSNFLNWIHLYWIQSNSVNWLQHLPPTGFRAHGEVLKKFWLNCYWHGRLYSYLLEDNPGGKGKKKMDLCDPALLNTAHCCCLFFYCFL